MNRLRDLGCVLWVLDTPQKPNKFSRKAKNFQCNFYIIADR